MKAKDYAVLLFILLVVGAACAYRVWFPYTPLQSGAGFGPDWTCVAQMRGDPVCWKRPGR